MYNKANMVLSKKGLFYLILVSFIGFFIYLDRSILAPFVVASIFAYIFNPVVNFFYHKIRLPRTFSIIIIYLIIMGIIILFGVILSRRILSESFELRDYIDNLALTARGQVNALPDWIRPTAYDTILSLQNSKLFSTQSVFFLFPQAISRIVSLFIFLFSAFYLLKDGREILDKFLNLVPNEYKVDVEILIRKINSIFAGYLRGQLFLVFLVSMLLFIPLSILGVRFALILAIFSGFAEIIPLIGPITAGSVAALVVLVTGGVSNFNLDPFQAALIVGIIYFFIRQFQDYFITPQVMGKITEIHPFLIFFAVLSGGHLFGILGYILAVPVAGTIKILIEFFMDKINENNSLNSDLKK